MIYRAMNRHHITLAVLIALLALLAVACAPQAPADTPRVFFAEPANEAAVASPVTVRMGAESFVVEPAGEVREGAGHLHIMVDTPCVAAGEAVPKDEAHLHFGQGQTEATLELDAGTHTLCLQAADGAHVALEGPGMTQELTVTVE
ncbi:MAG: DUF4399 domain-containing protein [Candidatus Promineifilaceae bacterium]|nr:DUF4399 domain-containing protein [Candidatus Promineifilaceae bacterium]